MRKFLTTFALAFTIIFLSSCNYFGSAENQEDSLAQEGSLNNEQNTTEAKETKNVLNIAARPLQSFNPLTNIDEHNKYVFSLIYDDLYYLDENLNYKSNILSSTIFSEDGMSATLIVKPGAKWSDGTGILADDIVYSINQLRYNQNPLYINNLSFVASASKTANDAVLVVFNKPMNENTFNLCVPIVQESFYDPQLNDAEMQKLKTNGSGKYQLTKVIDSRNYQLSVIDEYRNTANVKTINIKIIETFDYEIDAFNANIIDIIVMDPEDLKEVKNGETTTIINVPTNKYEFIALNFQNALINDINIRRALAYALPTDETIQSMFLNASVRTQTNVNPKSYLYNQDLTQYTEDFERSKQYLNSAGFTGADIEGFALKVTDTTTVSLDFNILVNEENTYRVNLAKKYAENLKAVGIKSQLIEVPFDEYMTRLNEGRYDLAFAGYMTDNSQNNSALFNTNNVLRYTNTKVQYTSSHLANAITKENYQAEISAFQNIVNTDLPVLSVCYKDILLLSNNEVSNVNVSIDNYFSNIENWVVVE